MTKDIKPVVPVKLEQDDLEKIVKSFEERIKELKKHDTSEYTDYIGKRVLLLLDAKGFSESEGSPAGYSLPIYATLSQEQRNFLILEEITIKSDGSYTLFGQSGKGYQQADTYKKAKINKDYIIGILEEQEN